MRIFISIAFLLCLAGAAWAGIRTPAPGPEMSAGLIGMALAGGVLYLIKRNRG
jgi:hypothetical protein